MTNSRFRLPEGLRGQRISWVAALALALIAAAKPMSYGGKGVITTGQRVTGAGARRIFDGRVLGVTFGGTDDEIVALNSGAFGSELTWYRWRSRVVKRHLLLKGYTSLPGIARDSESNTVFAVLLAQAQQMYAQLITIHGEESPRVVASALGLQIAGAPALTNARGLAAVPMTLDDRVAFVSTRSGVVLGRVSTGIAPYAAVLSHDAKVAYVSNWGGRFSVPSDLTETTGVKSSDDTVDPGAGRDHVVVDGRGIASTGTVARVDLGSMRVTNTIAVGRQPTALAWDQARARLYVANSNQDTISVIDTDRNRNVKTISLAPLRSHGFGIAPLSLVLSRDGATLYVACAGINAVTVIRTTTDTIVGAIPTDWYPDDIAISPSGRYLAVGTLLGIGSGWNDRRIIDEVMSEVGQTPRFGPHVRYVHIYRGAVDVLAIPSVQQLRVYSAEVARNNGARSTAATPWQPPPIRHVVYIVKENRSYDQVFGDMGKGNSDSSLVVFGRNITPNHHRLADDFVLLDNFYATGGNSGDGHQWVTQGNETPYVMLDGYSGRGYPFDGSDPIAYSKSGFIWNDALDRGLTVEDFGEFAGIESSGVIVGAGYERSLESSRLRLFHAWLAGDKFANVFHTVAPLTPLNRILVHDYPAYGMIVPDVVRAGIFLRHLRRWSRANSMPNLVIVQLPSDHTAGLSPGYTTPRAALADNDYALGQIVDGLSHSRFWKSMAIFVVEDDAQGGVDHVDGHRTVALVISPYVRRRIVDSTFYSHPSILKTIEEILGLRSMTLFDSIANDMRNSFTHRPNFTPYVAVKPPVPLLELNPSPTALRGPERAAAIASESMNFSIPDAAPPDAVNHMLWHAMRGWDTPYPKNGGRPAPPCTPTDSACW
jgi:YVTN family beta-propeller protein